MPSRAVPAIVAARSETARKSAPYAGPVELLGKPPREWGDPPGVRLEFDLLGLPLLEGNEDRSAGFVRIRELLRPDPDRLFPNWHPQAGKPGSPRLFLPRHKCPRLVEQLSSAPVETDDEPLPRAAVSARWESGSGGLVAALRYAVLSRPSPSKPAADWVEDMRARVFAELLANDERPVRPDWTW